MLLFWLVGICLLSSLDEIDVCVESITDDVQEANDDKPGFLSVEVDSFNWLFFHKLPMSLPTVEDSDKNRKYVKRE